MRASSWPRFTGELKSTRISLIWPEICEPTWTVVTAESVPDADTVAVRLPRSTFASRNSGALPRAPNVVHAPHATSAAIASAGERDQRARLSAGGERRPACLLFWDCRWRRAGVSRCGRSLPSAARRNLAPKLAQPRLDDRALVEVGVAGLERELELHDRALQVASPGVVLALVVVLLQPLAEIGVRARGDPVQPAVAGEAQQLRFDERRGLRRAACARSSASG